MSDFLKQNCIGASENVGRASRNQNHWPDLESRKKSVQLGPKLS